MSDSELSKGLNCPRCGGIVPIPDGQVIVRCPSCDFRSIVRGDVGVRRYQVPIRVKREQIVQTLSRFFNNFAIAFDAKTQSKISEVFVVYLPFWTLWGRALGWAFGEKQVGDSKNRRYEPREVKITQEMVWTGAACDVGEFGVSQVKLTNQPLEPFNSDALHASGMVFEPVGSLTEAREAAEKNFEQSVSNAAGLDRLSQLFVRLVNQRFGLVYYPLWVVRYLYRGRAFQVVVDGHSGNVLYGKAPGNVFYRAAMLVGGMALGAFLMLDVPSFLLPLLDSSSSDSSEGILAFAFGSFVVGIVLMAIAYNAFRFGEHYEFGGSSRPDLAKLTSSDYGDLFKVAMTALDGKDRNPLR
jgi:DNA-directed RNA polymerase subunit RPC12/RpoP